MDIPLIVLLLGALVFLGHFFDSLFNIFKIPDLLFLMIIGLVCGPLLGLITPDQFGFVGPIFATITLIIILFEGGVNLKIDAIIGSLRDATILTLINFSLTVIIIAALTMLLFQLSPLISLMAGVIVGGTTSAVVIPLVRYLNLQEESIAILSIESALSDVLCIVTFIAILEIYQFGELDIGFISGRLLASIFVALIIGVGGGIGWTYIHNKITICKDVFSTPAFVFILYGIVEWLGFSGAIAALAFGVTLGNIHYIKNIVTKDIDIELTKTERLFFSETVFLLKTFFFIFIGISLNFTQLSILLAGITMTGFLYVIRIPVVGVVIPRSIPLWDAIVMSVMIPKGLAAAVLASIPIQEGIIEGFFIKELVYSIILFSIVINSVLIVFLERTSLPSVYRSLFRYIGKQFSISGNRIDLR